MSKILDKLRSLDALNSWVRSSSGRHATASPQRRIYEAKRMALSDATRILGAKHYALTVPAKCRDCGGSGKYVDSYGAKFDHCWRCSNTGFVRLEFVESQVAEGIVWHSPRAKAWDLPIAGTRNFVEVDWDVNKPGRDLTPDEAARHLLVIDEAWPPRYRNLHKHCWEYCECTDIYSLYIGEWKEYCAHCRAPEPKHRFHKRAGRVECTLLACEECYAAKRGLDLFEAAIPLEMYQPPNVMAWINVNSALVWDGRAA